MSTDLGKIVKVALVTDDAEEVRDGLVSVALLFLAPLFLMLTLGVLHHRWTPSVPLLGYWECFMATATWACLTGGTKRVR